MSVKLDVVFIVRLLAVFAASSLLLRDIPGLSSGQAFAVQRAFAPTGGNRMGPSAAGSTPTNTVAPTDSVAGSTGTTAPVSVGGSVTGTIDTNGDQDWYRVSLTAGHSYRFTLNGESVSGQSALPNGYLTLISPSGASVASDNDSGGNYNALLNVTITSATGGSGTYYLAAQGYSGSTGGFRLSVTDTTPPPPTDTVPGSTGTTAPVSVGGSVTGTIDTNGDQDWYRVSLTAGHSYRFTLNGESVLGQSALPNGNLTLISPSGASVASDNDSGGNYNALLNVTITSATGGSGTYYLAAQGYSGSTGGFRLSVTDTTPPPPTDTVPGNTGTTASVSVGGSVTGTIDFSGDMDLYRVSLTSGHTYRFTLNGESVSGQSALPNAVLTLYSPSGAWVASDDESGGNHNALLNYAITSVTGGSGTYYLGAQGYSSNTGGFRLSVTDTTPPLPTDTVPDHTGTTASVSVGGSVTGTIDFSEDMDLYRVSLTSGHTYRFTLNGESVSGQSTLPDAYLTLYGPSGAWVASDDDSGGNHNSLLDVTITSATGGSGTYYLGALGYYSRDTGGFRLSVTDTTPPSTSATLADCLFNWGEANYSSLIAPRGARSSTSGPYYYRYYSQTNSYLGVSSADNHLYYLGPQSRNAILDVGAVATWYAQAGCR